VALSPGGSLGPYEVLSSLGAGGMGEVYRARDRRLGRDVALKVLRGDAASDARRLRRFETEARAVAALSHPNITAVHDVGSDDGVPYVVFELLSGETLRERLCRGAVPYRKAVELGIQVCQGLAAAHARGILHRDLKPENLFLTRRGPLKILDFGLAKLTLGAEAGEGHSTGETETQPGVLMGTVGYLSPEQAFGRPADARSDVFAAGVVLYEMISGRRPFHADTPPETLAAILRKDPPELTSPFGPVPPGLERIVRRCLEKEPEDRFQSARDVAFALEALSDVASADPLRAAGGRRGLRLSLRVGPRGLVLAGLGLLAGLSGTWILAQRLKPRELPRITQLTFRRGLVDSARFAPDGRTVVVSALWDGKPAEIFRIRLEDLEPEPVGVVGARLLAVSSKAELAVLLGRPDEKGWIRRGTLARVPFSGGAPRRLLEYVTAADWSPDGSELAVLREDGILFDSPARLEYPIGTVLTERIAGAREVRVHPSGDRVAVQTPDAVVVVERSGRQRTLGSRPATQGLSWDPGGRALWVSAADGNDEGVPGAGDLLWWRAGMWGGRALWRLTLDGRAEEVRRSPGGLTLDDVSSDGRILAHFGTVSSGVRVKPPGSTEERELETSGHASVVDISADGKVVLTREVLPRSIQAWIRPTAGGAGTRIADIPPVSPIVAMSPDVRWVAAWQGRGGSRADDPNAATYELTLIPTGSGKPRVIPTKRFEGPKGLGWFHFDKEDTILALASEPHRKGRGWIWTLSDDDWRPITPEGICPAWVRWPQGEVIGVDWSDPGYFSRRTYMRYPLDGGPPRPFPVPVPPEYGDLVAPSFDGRFGYLFVKPFGSIPASIDLLDLATGERTPWRRLQVPDSTGVTWIEPLQMFRRTTDAYAYGYTRNLQDLYLFEGLQ
jgi:hypothetical protein